MVELVDNDDSTVSIIDTVAPASYGGHIDDPLRLATDQRCYGNAIAVEDAIAGYRGDSPAGNDGTDKIERIRAAQ